MGAPQQGATHSANFDNFETLDGSREVRAQAVTSYRAPIGSGVLMF